jgi:hypothetical protein
LENAVRAGQADIRRSVVEAGAKMEKHRRAKIVIEIQPEGRRRFECAGVRGDRLGESFAQAQSLDRGFAVIVRVGEYNALPWSRCSDRSSPPVRV